MRQVGQIQFSSGSKQGREQALAGRGRPVIEVLVAAGFINQARLPEDAQVATNARLLALADQASIAHAKFPGLVQERQQGEAMRITESLALSAQASGLQGIEHSTSQLPGLGSVNRLQTQSRVPHFATQTNTCAYVHAVQGPVLKDRTFFI
jgi:hypothetical protein